MKKIFTFILLLTIGVSPLMALPVLDTARVQFIHDAPDASLDSLNIYINDSLYSNLANFKYLQYSPFLVVTPDVPVSIRISHASVNDTLYTLQLDSFVNQQNYVIVISGLLNTANYHPNPDGLNVGLTATSYLGAYTSHGTGGTGTASFIVFNGITDAPMVNVFVRGQGEVIHHLPYGTFSSGYLTVPAKNYLIDVKDTLGNLLKTFYASLSTASIVPGGAAAVVYIGGFVDTTGQGAEFDLYGDIAGLPLGLVAFPIVKTAKVQLVHNAADPALDSVNVYIKTTPDSAAIDSFQRVPFRHATPFLTLPSNVPLQISFASANGTATSLGIDSFVLSSLTSYGTYVVMATGVVNTANFPANPNNVATDFSAIQIDSVPALSAGKTSLLFINGAPDAKFFSIRDSSNNDTVLVNKLLYNKYKGYLNVSAADHILEVSDTGAANHVRYVYDADLSALGDSSLVIFSTGFVDSATGNRAFGLWAAKANGHTYPLTLLATGIVETSAAKNIVLYPNPATSSVYVNFSLEKASAVQYHVVNMLGQTIEAANVGNMNSGSNNLKLNVANYAKGMYMLNLLVGNNSTTTIRFVVE